MTTRAGGILERVSWTSGAGDKNMVGETKIGLIGPGLSTGANAQTSIVALKPDPTWLCPVCGLKRTIGNHKKCSKITQLKHRKERGEI
jgi:hypothetical protein